MIFGDQTVEPFPDQNAAGSAEAFPFRADTTGTAASVSVYIASSSKASSLIAGLYSDNSGRPGSRIATSALSSPTASAWNTVEIASTAISSGSTYWVAVLGTGGTLAFRDRSGGTCTSQTSHQTTLTWLPSWWKSGARRRTCPISAFVSGTSSVTILPPTTLAPPTITGTIAYGQTLTTSDGGWLDSPTSYTYQWQDCDTLGPVCTNIAGATHNTYTVRASDIGNTIRSVVTASNAAGSASSSSARTLTVAQPPAPTAAFGFSPGASETGQSAHFDGSTSTCAATPCSYAWTNGVSSMGSGQSLDVMFNSARTQARPSGPTNRAAPTISGNAQQGQTLNVSNGSWSGHPTSFVYKWEECNSSGASCTIISGATGDKYTLTASDVGSTIRAIVTATNASGSNSASSSQTAVVTASGGGGGTTPKNCAVMGANHQPDAATLDSCGYPSAHTTGVPAGVTLAPVAQASLPSGAKWSGSTLTISGNNVTVSGVDIENGTVTFTGSNSKLVNSKVTCGGGVDCVFINGVNGNTVSHTEIDGTSGTSNSGYCGRAVHMAGGATVYVDHLLVRNCADGVVGISHTSDSYIYINVVYCPSGASGASCSHDEPIYLPGGNGSITQDIEHNTLVVDVNQVAAVFGDDHAYGPLSNATVNNNLVMGSGSNGAIATGKPGDGNKNITITNNRYSYIYQSNMATGQSTPAPDTTWNGNYRDDTLANVPIQTTS